MAIWSIGDIESHVAGFIYRDPTVSNSNTMTVNAAQQAFQKLNTNDKYTYFVTCKDAQSFQTDLGVWCNKIGTIANPRNTEENNPNKNAFLLVYSHMGNGGLDAGDRDEQRSISFTWNQLYNCIYKYVNVLWLIGCDSIKFLENFYKNTPQDRLKCILVTNEEKYWGPLLNCYQLAYDMNNITYNDKLLEEIKKMLKYLNQVKTTKKSINTEAKKVENLEYYVLDDNNPKTYHCYFWNPVTGKFDEETKQI